MMRARTRAPGNPGLELPGCKVAMVLAAVALACCVSAHALDPNQPATSYLRTTFTVEDGLSSNVVNAIVQTRNGFLWIGTDAGLDRFDGRNFTPIYFRGPSSTPQGTVSALAEGLERLQPGRLAGKELLHDGLLIAAVGVKPTHAERGYSRPS